MTDADIEYEALKSCLATAMCKRAEIDDEIDRIIARMKELKR